MSDHKKRNVGDIIMIPFKITGVPGGVDKPQWYDFQIADGLEETIDSLTIWVENFHLVEFKDSPLPTEPGAMIVASVRLNPSSASSDISGLTLVKVNTGTINTWANVDAGRGRLWYRSEEIVKWEPKK